VLDAQRIEYLVTGSLASSVYGEPRATHDIDLVVAMNAAAIAPLLEAFPPPEFYLSEAAMHEALATNGMFNLLATAEGDQVNFWMRTDTPFNRSRFARRRREEVLGLSLQLPSPEDVILAKLEWSSRAGGSSRQYVDALRVYEVYGVTLDREYLERWARELSVADLWHRMQAEAEPL